MLTKLRSDSTRGSIVKTPSSITTMSIGSTKASAQPSRPWPLAWPRRATISLSDNGRPALDKFVDGHRQHDDHAEKDRLDTRIDLEKVHCVRQNQQEHRGQSHHFDLADTALQADSGNDRGGDALESQLRADHRLARADLRSE